MHILLLTTCDLLSPRQDELARLTRSLSFTALASPHQITHILLVQRAQAQDMAPMAAEALPFHRICLFAPTRLSLAVARNAMLGTAQAQGLLRSADWVAFPDDDAWYPPGLVDEVSTVFEQHPGVSMVTCRYGAQPQNAVTGAGFLLENNAAALVRVLSSNTLFVRRSAVEAVGLYFDERLGLGATINGGEDLDYALRVMAQGGCVAFDPGRRVGHRDAVIWTRSTYFEGSLCALARAAALSARLRPPYWRKLLVGSALVARGELPLGRLWAALRQARSFGRQPRQVQAHGAALARVQRASAATTTSTRA